jgi:hypothetical protein
VVSNSDGGSSSVRFGFTKTGALPIALTTIGPLSASRHPASINAGARQNSKQARNVIEPAA